MSLWSTGIHGIFGIRYSDATLPSLANRLRQLPDYKWKREDAVRALRVAISPSYYDSKRNIYFWIKCALAVIAIVGSLSSLIVLLKAFSIYSIVGVAIIQLTVFFEYRHYLRREFDWNHTNVLSPRGIIPVLDKPGILCMVFGFVCATYLGDVIAEIGKKVGGMVMLFGLFCSLVELFFFWPAKYFIRKNFVSLWDDLVEYDPSLADEFGEYVNKYLEVKG